MNEDALELTTDDLLIEEPEPPRPRFVPSVLSRPIKEKSRAHPQSAQEEQGSSTGLAAKARAFYEEALEAERAGDRAAAIRHVKLAITFDPRQQRYQEMLKKLGA